MESSSRSDQKGQLIEKIIEFVERSNGLDGQNTPGDQFEIVQKLDGKRLVFHPTEVDLIYHRKDSEERPFVQVNFTSGVKILLTEDFIGFKPVPMLGLDQEQLPKVVTTPDLISVFEAFEEAFYQEGSESAEVQTLRKVFFSIICGGEAVGFDLECEKNWVQTLPKAPVSA
ncbi:MAG: hypothetical protein COT74_06400 [Bdellovibrionales bacterium CG10_big_fil_rev_8_21_14_0_10_45_34]|nr:MAG: hypothetical protein COT74_06400 [Bdellovibrionales bacterium CG10_big_fil_rev_8_21_14_0_10_45_34]